MTRTTTFIALALLALASGVPADAAQSPNARLLANIDFNGGSDLDFEGNLAYVGSFDEEEGGLYIIDISEPDRPEVLGHYPCWGNQDDVGALGGGYVVMGMHSGEGSRDCGPTGLSGLRFIDARDPARPDQISFLRLPSGGTHTVTVVGRTGYLYSNPGGLGLTAGPQTTQIIDARDPANPMVVGSFRPPGSLGCHDVNVNADATRAYCAGSNVTQIWDIADPVHPVLISAIANPAIFFHHTAVPSTDGKTLVISDEAFGAHVCDPAGRNPTGAFWFYDISIEQAPVLRGWISQTQLTQSGALIGAWCTAHNFNMVPGRNVMVAAAYTGGTSVIDFSDPSVPQVTAWIRPPGADTWSSYYRDGYIYTGDINRGFDVIEVDGLATPS